MVFFSYQFKSTQNILLANSENPDQTPPYVAADLGLHCLPMSHKKDPRLIWVNTD